MKEWEMALIILAIIGIVFAGLFIAVGIGSTEASAGHFLKDTLQGSPIEHPAASIEDAGNSLAASAQRGIAIFTGFLAIIGLMYIAANSKS